MRRFAGKKVLEYIDLSTIIGLFAAVFGGAASLFAAYKTEVEGFFTAFTISLVMELVVIVIWGLYLCEKFRHKSKEVQLREQIIESEKMCEKNRKEVEAELKKFQYERDEILKKLNIISLSIKNNSIHNNEQLVKVPSEGDASYQYSKLVTETDSLTNDQKKEHLIGDAENYANKLYVVFKQYCVDMLREVIKLETAYINIRGFDLDVSATIKLFDKPYIHNKDVRTDIKIYTAFRDKETYEDKGDDGMPKREIGKRYYSIDLNADFTDCLTRDYFFINNASRETNNYRNEHEDFDAFYNCAIVVPIRTKLSNGNKRFLGYLCCDCLNDKYPDKEIFDRGAAQYLFAFAQNLATFFETMETNWIDRFSDNVVKHIPKNAIEMIHKKTIHIIP